MQKRTKVCLLILIAIPVIDAVGMLVSLCQRQRVEAKDEPTQSESEDAGNLEEPVPPAGEFLNKSSESPEFFAERTGIVLPEGTRPIYMVHNDSLFPPYRLEGRFIIPGAEIENFIEDNPFEAVPQRWFDLSFLETTDSVPAQLQATRTDGTIYILFGDNSQDEDVSVRVWWKYVLNADSGDLWIQHSTE